MLLQKIFPPTLSNIYNLGQAPGEDYQLTLTNQDYWIVVVWNHGWDV